MLLTTLLISQLIRNLSRMDLIWNPNINNFFLSLFLAESLTAQQTKLRIKCLLMSHRVSSMKL